MSKIDIYRPNTLTIIATHKCTAECESCCFDCGPKRQTQLSEDSIKNIIDETLSSFPSVKLVVLTGGEAMLLGIEALCRIIRYTKEKSNLHYFRIVSNGYWAYSVERAKQILSKLRSAGLDELSISTGDYHQKFVPVSHIYNIITAHETTNSILHLAISVEDHRDGNLFKKSDLDIFVKKFNLSKSKRTFVVNSPWIENGQATRFQVIERDLTKYRSINELFTDEVERLSFEKGECGCDSLYSGIQINPQQQMLACCGFAAEYSPLLKLGDIRNHRNSLNSYLNEQYYDIVKMLLYVYGAKRLYRFFTGKALPVSIHNCEVCLHILQTATFLEAIMDLKKNSAQVLLAQFHQKRSQTKYE